MKIPLVLMCCLFLFFITSCGDIVSKGLHITRNYFLSDGENQGNYSICFKDGNGTLIKKVTEKVIAYGYSDSVIVAKVLYMNEISYFIINMNKDFDVAKENVYRLGPLNETDFLQNWNNQLHIDLKSTNSVHL